VGGGYASFVVADGRAFTIEQRRDQEVVAAYHLKTGREIWTHGWTAEFRETLGGDGPRATPTLDEGRVYALGASGDLKVLEEASGEVLWERNILEDAGADNLQWGMSGSPLIVDEKVVVLPGGPNGSSAVAYDKRTGATLWKSLDDEQAYTSPILVTLSGERQILVVGANRAMGLAVDDGSLLWDYPWVTNMGINVAQPLILDEKRVFLSAGYGHGAVVLEVTQGESGFAARPVWSNTRMKNKFASSVLHQGYIYGLDEAILACVDASTGELKWKGGRYGYGQLLLAANHLIVLTERGEIVLVKATPEKHEELAMFPAIEGKTWNHPVIADGVLMVRNANEMAAFRIAP
jgi:outer membrane protein assembly factor BamB